MAANKSVGGRVVVLGLFWGLFAYLTIAVVGSVFMSLYGKPPSHAVWPEAMWRNKQRLWCVATLSGLKDELEAEVVHELSHPELQGDARRERWRRFHATWEQKHTEGAHRCTADLDPLLPMAYAQLDTLYSGYTDGLSRISDTRADAEGALEASLRALKGGPGAGRE